VEGTPFGRYRLIELLGRGGMGEVWRAYDTTIDRVVAIKMLLPHYAQDPDFEKRFRREARIAARLDDPHIVPIHDVGEIDGRLYVTMRLINGVNLQDLLDNGPLEPGRAVHIIEQVASALHTAHQAGLVHRDVKPSNILLAHNDFAYLIDFGIARAADDTGLTSAGSTIGTWAYMAPERFSAGEIKPSSDVYALACVLYQCLTGRTPFPGTALEQVAVGHMVNPPPKPSESADTVPKALDDVIATGLAKQPTNRYASTLDMAAAARQAITDPVGASDPALQVRPYPPTDPTQLSTPAVPLPVAPPSPKRPRRRAVLIGALASVALLIVAGGVVAGVMRAQHNKQSATPAPNMAPFIGTYRADFSTPTNLNGGPMQGAQASTATWGVRSVCRAEGCVATASRLSGGGLTASSLEFDAIDGHWVAVGLGSQQCRGATVEIWDVFALQPQPDGTLTGDYSAITSNGCAGKGSVTFTRTGDVDVNSLPDPATLPPRVVSPADALHGRYLETTTFANGQPPTETTFSVTTDCLRTGDRCMSYFHAPASGFVALVFGGGQWTSDLEGDAKCPYSGDPSHVTETAQFPLPQPPQNPIATLTGHGHQVHTGSCAINTDVDITFTRIGD
jgi:predicted Ser/Thr protein kinase